MEKIQPFLKWAGGKRNLVKYLIKFVPKDYMDRYYWEPFLGSGAMFFSLWPTKATLSDLNKYLIDCYKMVRDHPNLINSQLSEYEKNHSESFYYKLREEYNHSEFSIEQAARFIYLNKSSFNGIFRVNSKGKFNVPYGKKEKPSLPTKKQLRSLSIILKKVKLSAKSYDKVLLKAQKGDFVYLDPPYPPLNGKTAYFTHYTKEKFGEEDQKKLAETAEMLNKRGCLVMISNADIKIIRDIFINWDFTTLSVTRYITCKKEKHKVNELVITNY